MIGLDTSVLSLAFRRSNVTSPIALQLRRLIEEDAPLSVPGIVFQELLSGVREPAQFARLHDLLEGFPPLLATKADHTQAAHLANTCRQAGIATTTPDCLIAAQTITRNGQLLTTDKDFDRMASCSGLRLFGVVE